MADTEFEEFRQYFDKLPQYIKAPPDCYSLIPNIDLLEDDSPTAAKPQTISDAPKGSCEDQESIQEPFSGDLQVVYVERESPIVTRKRRKLPEIPKSPRRKWNEETRQVSLAQELSDAAKLGIGARGTSIHGMTNLGIGTDSWLRQGYRISNKLEEPSSANLAYHRPSFILKFNDNEIGGEESSSPDSDKYPSLDSGHSTIHSDDGSKPYSPQVTSINESFSSVSPSLSGIPFSHLDILEATHRGLHKFIPRHHDEIEVDIGDPIYMEKEADDLWCEGVNLRSGMQGIFPSAYVVDVEYNDFDPSTNKVKKERYLSNYIGSIETLYHKGNEVLCQAVKKISAHENYVATHTRPCILEISDQGIRMLDKGKHTANHTPCHDYFYALKNVSFCGFHPNDHRYFGFVTKHPTLNRFACHVFISDDSTRPVAEAVGRAFQRFYQKFLETAYPIEDIYLE